MDKLITVVLITLSTSIFSQNQIAKEVLERLSTTTKSYENMSIEFDLILENKNQNIKDRQQGTLVLAGEKFQLTMGNQTIINNGESQWIYLSDMNEVQIINHNPEDKIMTPNKLFSIYEEGYKYTYIGAETENGKRLQIIDLFPKESNAFMKVTLAVDAAKNQLHKITVHDKNGGTYTYLINSFLINKTVKPFTFNTSDFPKVEVIDLR